MPGNGVNVKKQADVAVSIPDKLFDYIRIKSEVGNVKIENVDTEKLTVDTQCGDITLSEIEGHITVKAESIKTDLQNIGEIINLGTGGQELTGQIGDSDYEINLYTNTGAIELR
jgi:DUF4097 and DUF4098 domain-containing protein YvlB